MLERGNMLAATTLLDEKLNGFVRKQGNDFDAHLYKLLSPCTGRRTYISAVYSDAAKLNIP